MGIKKNGMIRCNKCGRCCYYEFEGKLKRCCFLIDMPYGKTKCAIYENRLRVIIDIRKDGTPIICKPRVEVKKHYKSCPYNQIIKLPIHL